MVWTSNHGRLHDGSRVGGGCALGERREHRVIGDVGRWRAVKVNGRNGMHLGNERRHVPAELDAPLIENRATQHHVQERLAVVDLGASSAPL